MAMHTTGARGDHRPILALAAAVLVSTVGAAAHAQARGVRPEAPPRVQAAARADRVATSAKPAERKDAFFVGAALGLGWASVRHPGLASPDIEGVMVAAHIGYSPTPRFWFALELTSLEERISRSGAGAWYGDGQGPSPRAPGAQPLAACSDCPPRPRGGTTVVSMLHVISFGPRAEITPFGRDGVFFGGSVGGSVIDGVGSSAGFAGTARAGFRVRPVEPLTVAIEGGGQGHVHEDADALIGFAMLQGRAHF